MKVKKTGKSKYGFYLMDENDKFTGCSEAVSNYVAKHLPCEVEVTELEGKMVSKVNISRSADQTPQESFHKSIRVVTNPAETSMSKDKLIIRQSCLKCAVAYSQTSEIKMTAPEVLAIAGIFEEWVWRE